MEALVSQLRQTVSSSAEFKMLLAGASGSMKLDEGLLNEVDLLLDSEEFCEELASRFVETCKDKAAAMFADQEEVHRRFCADPKRTDAWFNTFSMEGMQHFGPGAKALANYSLRERVNVWRFLHWRRAPVTPVIATRKPVVFCELSVVPTITRLLREYPQFLWCRELTEACRSAAWVSCSLPFFAQETQRLLSRGNPRRVSTARLALSHLLRGQHPDRHVKWALSHMPQDAQLRLLLRSAKSVEQEISIQKLPSISAANVQYSLVFGTITWASFDELLVAFSCVYQSSRLRDVLSATLGSSFLDNVCENVSAVHQDVMELLKEHATISVTCKRTSLRAQVLLQVIVSAFAWEIACCRSNSFSMFEQCLEALGWHCTKPAEGVTDAEGGDSDVDPLLVMRGKKESRRSKRKASSQSVDDSYLSMKQAIVGTGVHRCVQAQQSAGGLKEFRASQICELVTLETKPYCSFTDRLASVLHKRLL